MKTSKYLNYRFESSSGLTKEFSAFARAFKSDVKYFAGPNWELLSFSRGHFYCSGFLQNKASKAFVYFMTSDVRFFPNAWANNLLVRTAKHEKDYTGGANCFCALEKIGLAIDRLNANVSPYTGKPAPVDLQGPYAVLRKEGMQ